MNGVERICFIGAGSMAEAMLAGLLKNRRIDADRVSIFNRHRRERLDQLTGSTASGFRRTGERRFPKRTP